MKIVLFNPAIHNRKGFACGDAGLDEYLHRYASQSVRQRMVQLYVAAGETGRVLGYYTLSAASLRHQELPEAVARRLPNYPVPAILIGRMASDRSAREAGQRVGSLLLIHALKRALRAAQVIGVQCVIVDSKPEAVGFYRRFGFLALNADGLKYYLPIQTIQKMAQGDE